MGRRKGQTENGKKKKFWERKSRLMAGARAGGRLRGRPNAVNHYGRC